MSADLERPPGSEHLASLLPQARQLVREAGVGSVSLIQRHLRVGYLDGCKLWQALLTSQVIPEAQPRLLTDRDLAALPFAHPELPVLLAAMETNDQQAIERLLQRLPVGSIQKADGATQLLWGLAQLWAGRFDPAGAWLIAADASLSAWACGTDAAHVFSAAHGLRSRVQLGLCLVAWAEDDTDAAQHHAGMALELGLRHGFWAAEDGLCAIECLADLDEDGSEQSPASLLKQAHALIGIAPAVPSADRAAAGTSRSIARLARRCGNDRLALRAFRSALVHAQRALKCVSSQAEALELLVEECRRELQERDGAARGFDSGTSRRLRRKTVPH